MNRLTERNGDYGSFLDRQAKDSVLLKWGDESLYEKCQEIENIEEDIGIDFVTIVKALKDGIYTRNSADKKRIIKMENNIAYFDGKFECAQFKATPVGEMAYTNMYIVEDSKLLSTERISNVCNIERLEWHDCGKTWALTKEELENEK